MRAFVSLDLPEHVKSELFHPFEKIKNAGLVSGNFVEKDNLHLTLNFLGDVSEEQIEKIISLLGKIKFPSFEIKTGKVGFFPNESYVKVIWAEVISENVLTLKKEIDVALSDLGFKLDEKEFKEHITLARIKSIKNKESFQKGISGINLKEMKFKIEKFSLIKSELTKEGPKYKTLKSFNLASK